MNTKRFLDFGLKLFFSGLLFTVISCTKEGPPGKPGLDGKDGKDGAESCTQCHNANEQLRMLQGQYANSGHARGLTITYNSAACAQCHTSMGFRNFLTNASPQQIDNPTPINCRTCHPIHESFTGSDYNLRTTSGVNLLVGNATYNYGNSNICANCHQARPINPYPVPGGPNITITNQFYGPHYGPQANMFMGKGPVEIAGSMPYQNSPHSTIVGNSCITCHMSTAIGLNAGGHQMKAYYTNSFNQTVYNYAGCNNAACHTDVQALDQIRAQNRAEISALLDQLHDKLLQRGLINADGYVPVPKTMSQTEAAAVLNYKFVKYDGSKGFHNYLYTKALLLNTLQSLL